MAKRRQYRKPNASSPFHRTTTTPSAMSFGFSSSHSTSSSSIFGGTAPGTFVTDPPWLLGTSSSSTVASTDTSTMPCFPNAISSTSAKTSSITVPSSDPVSSVTSSSSVLAITTTTLTATPTSSLSGKAEFVTVPASCSLEQDKVAAILASQCEKLLSCRAARHSQYRGQNERHVSVDQPWAYVATGFETTSSTMPVGDPAHIPDTTAEQKYGESKLSSFLITGAPSTSSPSALLDSKSGSSLLPSSQPAEEEQPYIPPADLLDSTIEMWKRVVVNKKTDQDVTEEGLCHFYEGINYFCLLSERLQVANDKYNEAGKERDDMRKMNSSLKDKLAESSRKLEGSEKEKERLEHELAGAANKITTLTGEKKSILRIHAMVQQTLSELRMDLEEAGHSAIQKYKASCLYRQELMEYAAPYMGKGVKLAIEKIKAVDPAFDPASYGLEMYILPPEVNDQ